MIGVGRIRPSLNEFKVFFNEKTRNVRPELVIHQIEVKQKNHAHLFFIRINPKDAILGSLSKSDGSIKQIAIIRGNDGSARSKFEFLISITLVLEALRPNMEMKRKSKILESVQFFNKEVDLFNTHVTGTFEDLSLMLLSTVEGGFFTFCITFR